ncbi:MAG: TlpA disulfide reductase family protein [Bacteroidota bacterium]
MKTYTILLHILLLALVACQPAEPESVDPTGTWQVSFNLGKATLPTIIQIQSKGEDQYTALLVNGEETLAVESVSMEGDSLSVRMAIFDTEMKGVITGNGRWEGTFYNYSRSKDYQIPFVGIQGIEARFQTEASLAENEIAGRWETYFSPEDPEGRSPAVGIFQQEGKRVTGTFLTETGDYRFLEGVAEGDSLKLSCFDGDHAFLFLAGKDEEGQLAGVFYSGTHWEEPWIGKLNEEFELRDPNVLTYLKPGYEKISFSFPDLDSNMVSLEDPVFQGKVVVVQIMGSWCPNCMDETKLFAKYHEKFHEQGLEIVALAYERAKGFEQASKSVKRLKDHFGLDYHTLIAGTSSKTQAAETLPMLNHIMSFPTSIFMDRQGRIRKIHTGFYGPGTGKYYDQFVEETDAFLTKLLEEV